MGRNKASQSRKREEKSKVKLKGHKTKFLPKGLNITDTRFKVRKIVVPDQLKVHSSDQPLSKKKLNIQDILVKLRHHNTNQRREGLQGLRELICEADAAFLSINLGNVIINLAKLALDPEKDVRHDNFKTLRLILEKALEEVEPFFETLSSYLSCAMTHIQISIQEDSLLLTDILLEHTPFLIARSAQHILPCFLDMISRLKAEQKPDRLLSMNLSGKLSAVQWRLQVLQRLQRLLRAMMEHYKNVMSVESDSMENSGKDRKNTVFIATENRQFYPIYSDRFSSDCELQIFSQTGSTQSARLLLKNVDEFKTYIDTLTNLLVECWLEVRPDSKKQIEKSISTEASVLLYSTFEIMQLLWEYVKLWETDNISHNLDSWFQEKYLSTISRHFLPGFPYSSDQLESNNAEKGGKSKKKAKVDGTSGIARPDCVSQNLALCHLFVEMSTSMKSAVAQQMIDYITGCVNKKNLANLEARQLVAAVKCVFKKHNMWLHSRINLEPLMIAMVKRCSGQNHWLEQQLSAILLELLQIDFNRKFQSVSVVEKWITTLPQILCRNFISIGTLKLFSKLACQRNLPFLEALQRDLPLILANMRTLVSCGSEGHLCLASLFHQVPEWSTEARTEFRKQLDEDHVPSIVKEVIALKLSDIDDC